MNIYDIDKLGIFIVGNSNVKTFYKKLGSGGKLVGVEAGCNGKDRVYLAFDVKDENAVRNYHIHNRHVSDGKELPYRLAFVCSGNDELRKFIEALEFALGVLKQGENLECPF